MFLHKNIFLNNSEFDCEIVGFFSLSEIYKIKNNFFIYLFYVYINYILLKFTLIYFSLYIFYNVIYLQGSNKNSMNKS